jgi:16S rRNA G966 N2-methylase RsmD
LVWVGYHPIHNIETIVYFSVVKNQKIATYKAMRLGFSTGRVRPAIFQWQNQHRQQR